MNSARNDLNSVLDVGGLSCQSYSVFVLSNFSSPGLIARQRYSTELLKQWHCLVFKVTPAVPRHVNISAT